VKLNLRVIWGLLTCNLCPVSFDIVAFLLLLLYKTRFSIVCRPQLSRHLIGVKEQVLTLLFEYLYVIFGPFRYYRHCLLSFIRFISVYQCLYQIILTCLWNNLISINFRQVEKLSYFPKNLEINYGYMNQHITMKLRVFSCSW
jgi:hypothetical protein